MALLNVAQAKLLEIFISRTIPCCPQRARDRLQRARPQRIHRRAHGPFSNSLCEAAAAFLPRAGGLRETIQPSLPLSSTTRRLRSPAPSTYCRADTGGARAHPSCLPSLANARQNAAGGSHHHALRTNHVIPESGLLRDATPAGHGGPNRAHPSNQLLEPMMPATHSRPPRWRASATVQSPST